MARTDPQLNIRIPQDMKDLIETTAKENGNSITQEIIARLQFSFDKNLDTKNRLAEGTTLAMHLMAIMSYLPKDGRYSRDEVEPLMQKIFSYMLTPEFIRFFKNATEKPSNKKPTA